MAKNLIGHTTCPECTKTGAEVGLDKSGNPYRVCLNGDCEGAQYFTLGKAGRVRQLLARTAYVPGFDPTELHAKFGIAAPAPAPGADPAQAKAAPRASATLLG